MSKNYISQSTLLEKLYEKFTLDLGMKYRDIKKMAMSPYKKAENKNNQNTQKQT